MLSYFEYSPVFVPVTITVAAGSSNVLQIDFRAFFSAGSSACASAHCKINGKADVQPARFPRRPFGLFLLIGT
jgi:hypothetical protein